MFHPWLKYRAFNYHRAALAIVGYTDFNTKLKDTTFFTILHYLSSKFFPESFWNVVIERKTIKKKATTMTTSNATFSIFLAALIKDLCGSLIRQAIFFMFLALSRKVLPNFLENCKKAPPIRYWTNNRMLYKVNILHY